MWKGGNLWENVVKCVSLEDTSPMIGSAKARMDEKGRLAVPVRYRDLLVASAPVMTAHPHGCIVVYSGEEFAAMEKQVAEMPNTGFWDATLQEMLLGFAEEAKMDSAGRLLLSPALRDHAGIERDTLLLSVRRALRVWDERRWEQRKLAMQAALQDGGLSEQWRNLVL